MTDADPVGRVRRGDISALEGRYRSNVAVACDVDSLPALALQPQSEPPESSSPVTVILASRSAVPNDAANVSGVHSTIPNPLTSGLAT